MSISASADTTFWIFYGNSGVSTFQGGAPGSAWSANYGLVLHLAGTTPTDASSNGNTVSNQSGATAATGEIGGALGFNGSSQYLRVTSSSSIKPASGITLSGWMNTSNASNSNQEIFALGYRAADNWNNPYISYQLQGSAGSTGQPSLGLAISGNIYTVNCSATVAANGWHYVVGTYDLSNLKVYLDGTLCGTTAQAGSAIDYGTSGDMTIGQATAYDPGIGCYFVGSLDELRIQNVAEPATQVNTEYNNQSAPGTFITLSFPSVSISPGSAPINNTRTYTLTGVNTSWTSPGTGLFTLSGGTGASLGSISVLSATSATASITSGSAAGTLTITDTSTGSVTGLVVNMGGCPGYAYSATLTVGQVNSALANFPVLVSATMPPQNVLSPQGNDICVSDTANTTRMPLQWLSTTPTDGPVHEWNWQTGQANFVFNASSLSASAPSAFTIWTGNPFATNPDSTGAWDANTALVAHLQEAVFPVLNSATGATSSTGSFSGRSVGQIGLAETFASANSQHLPFGSLSGSGGSTSTALVKLTTTNSVAFVDGRGYGCGMGSGPWLYASGGLAKCTVNSQTLTGGAINDANWHHVGCAVNGSDAVLYVDGAVAQSGSSFSNFAPSVTVGSDCGGSNYLDGSLEEVRYSAGARSTAWVAAEAANLLHPGAFVTIGAWTFAAPAGPAISGATLAGNSPSSLLASWTTTTAATSQVLCGTASGGPYSYFTPMLHPVQSGSAFYGVSNHSIAITGLPNSTSSTAYYCVLRSIDVNGNWTTSGEMHAGTLAAIASTPVAVSWASDATRPNDQPAGSHGMPVSSCWFDGDTQYSAWAADGNQYGMCEDCGGPTNAHSGSNIIVLKWNDANHRCGTYLQSGSATSGGYPSGDRWDSVGPISVNGVIYQAFGRYSSGNYCCTSVLKTTDYWAHSISPQDNSGPSATGAAGIDWPTPGNAMWNRGTILFDWVQYGQDYNSGGSLPRYAGMDGWVYAVTTDGGPPFSLIRVRTEDLPLQDPTRYQYYAGAQAADDGLYDTGWTYDYTQQVKPNNTSTLAASYSKATMTFIPDFNRFLMVANTQGAGGFTAGTQIMDLQYPWSHVTLIANVPRSPAFINHFPGFGQLLPATYAKTSNTPTADITLSTASGYGQNSTTAWDDYSTFTRFLSLAPRSGGPVRPVASSNSRNAHVVSGLDVLYNFQGFGGDVTLINRSPNDPTGTYNATVTWANALYYDQYGLYNFGWPNTGSGSCCWGNNQSYTLTTPYAAPLGAFTAVIVFAHYPATAPSSGGTITVAVPSNETALSKAGDLIIQRHGTTASWDVIVKGTTVTSTPLGCTDGAFCGFVVRRDSSNNVTVYRSNSIQALLPVTPDGTGVVSGAWSSSAVTLGSTLIGVISESLVWSRALTDAELVREMGVIRRDMAVRGISLP